MCVSDTRMGVAIEEEEGRLVVTLVNCVSVCLPSSLTCGAVCGRCAHTDVVLPNAG